MSRRRNGGRDERLREAARRVASDPADKDAVRDLCDEVSSASGVPVHARPSERTAHDLVSAGMQIEYWSRQRAGVVVTWPVNENWLVLERPDAFRVNFSELASHSGAAGAQLVCWAYDPERGGAAAVWLIEDGRAGFVSGSGTEVLMPFLVETLRSRWQRAREERARADERGRRRQILRARIAARASDKLGLLLTSASMADPLPAGLHDFDQDAIGPDRVDGGADGQWWANVPLYVRARELPPGPVDDEMVARRGVEKLHGILEAAEGRPGGLRLDDFGEDVGPERVREAAPDLDGPVWRLDVPVYVSEDEVE